MLTRFVVTAVASALFAGVAMAQCSATKAETAMAADGKSAKKACCMDDKSGKSACNKSCSGEAAVAAMPAMKYQVGDKTVCCTKEAKELAKGDEKAIKFVVAGKTYEKQGEAVEAYTKALNDYRNELTMVKYAVGDQCVACPASAGEMAKKEGKKVQYRLASYTFESEDAANKAAKAAREAAEKVEMKIMVGDKAVGCPVSAGEMAKKEGKKVEFVVGESRSCCNEEANLTLAKARAQAALAVVEKAANPKA